jgi:hypothetical protein
MRHSSGHVCFMVPAMIHSGASNERGMGDAAE